MPKNDNTKQLIILLPESKHKAFKSTCVQLDTSMQSVIDMKITKFLSDYTKAKAKLRKKK